MSTTNGHSEMMSVGTGHSETATEGNDHGLPDNYKQLAAVRAAAEAKMLELRTTRAPALKAKWEAEAEEAGLTVDEVLHGVVSQKRGRGRKSKES